MARYITALLCVSVVIATLSYVVTPTTADDTSDSAAETNGYLLHINQVCHPHLIAGLFVTLRAGVSRGQLRYYIRVASVVYYSLHCEPVYRADSYGIIFG